MTDLHYSDIALQELRRDLPNRITPNLVAGFGQNMPIVQRESEVELLWQNLKDHFRGWKQNLMERMDHPRCFTYGPPGVGKTRLGVNIIELLQKHGRLLAKPTALDKELLDHLDSCKMIHITFGNGCCLDPEEDTSVDSALVGRAIRFLFKFSTPIAELKQSFPFIKRMTWPQVIDIVLAEFQPKMIYVHLDEFNALPMPLLKQVVHRLTDHMLVPSKHFFWPLFTGTTYFTMKQVGTETSNPLVELPIKILSEECKSTCNSILR